MTGKVVPILLFRKKVFADLLLSIVVMAFYPNKKFVPWNKKIHMTIPIIDVASPVTITLTIFICTTTFVLELSVFMMITMLRVNT